MTCCHVFERATSNMPTISRRRDRNARITCEEMAGVVSQSQVDTSGLEHVAHIKVVRQRPRLLNNQHLPFSRLLAFGYHLRMDQWRCLIRQGGRLPYNGLMDRVSELIAVERPPTKLEDDGEDKDEVEEFCPD
jgi:hypothetical protein